jgi:uncharacterized membrane protein
LAKPRADLQVSAAAKLGSQAPVVPPFDQPFRAARRKPTAEDMNNPLRRIGRYILIGLLTAAPLVITWWIVSFLFIQLSKLGAPLVRAVSLAVRPRYPELADVMIDDMFLSIAAALIVLLFLLILGWSTGRVIGQRLIELFERIIGAIPFVDSIYRASKRFLSVAGETNGERRVVLIDFPSPDMKAIGLLTRTLQDSESGETLAAVYVPTAPNPTSGYIEIVPLRSVVFTDWTFDQAMSFVVTGGSSAPDSIRYRRAGA